MNISDRLFNLARREIGKLRDDIIVRSGQHYTAFGQYKIYPNKDTAMVDYRGNVHATFSNTKVAISYCIAERLKQLALCRRIQELDQHLQCITQSLQDRQVQLMRCSNQNTRNILASKVQHRAQQHATVKKQLEDCVKLTKYFYLKGFNNETQRT